MAKFLSETGLQTVWSKIDSLFVRKASIVSAPAANSTSPISAGGVYSALEEIEDTVAASENALNTRVTTLENNTVSGSGLTADKIILGNGGRTVKTSGKGITTTAPSSSSDDTTIPTSKAVWSAFGSVASALKYKGTIASSGGTVTALPASHAVGDVYVVKTAGTYAGKACEVGDYIICNTAGTSANNAHWDVLNGENQVENKSASLAAAGQSATIATVDGTDITVTTPSTWTGLAKTGTVTSVGMTVPTGLSVSGSPITSSGTLAVSFASGYSIPTTAKQGNWDTAYDWGNHASAGYVKLNPGANEQTIKSSISSMSKGVVNLWRSSGDHYTFLGFSNGTTETALGGIGYKSQADHNLYKKDGSNYYKIWDENNYTTWINTTSYPGLSKTGTVTSVTLTSGTGITVSDSGTAITGSGSRTISLNKATTSVIGGMIPSNVLTTAVSLTSANGSTSSRYYGVQMDKDGKAFVNVPWTSVSDANIKISDGTTTNTIITAACIGTSSKTNTLTISASQNITATVGGSAGSATLTLTGPDLSSYLTSSSTLDATKLSGTIPSSCYTDTDTDIRFADFFGSCGTTASTAAKETSNNSKTLAASDLVDGLTAIIYHSTRNSASYPTLNVGTSGAKTVYGATGNSRLTGSTAWAQYDIIRWVYDARQGGWRKNAVLGNGTSQRLRLLTDRAPLYSETYTGTVTSVTLTSGTGITVSDSGTAITGSGSRTISLASGVATAGTYKSVTVDTYGRVTSGTNPTTLSGYGITDAKIASGVITLGSNTITPLTSASTLDATKLSGTIPSSCYTDTDTDIRFADYFGESTSNGGTTAKTTTNNSKTLASSDLKSGLTAIIWHQYANNATGVTTITLNVGGSGAKAMYNAAGTRITGSAAAWSANDIIRWVYDASLNSNAGGWKLSAILGNGSSHRFRVLTGGKTPLYSAVTSVTLTSGTGITVSDSGTAITSSGSRTISLNKATTSVIGGMMASNALTTAVSLTSANGSTASRYYGVQVDKDGKAFVNIPWEANTHNSHALTVTNGTASAASGDTITYVESVTGCSATSGNLTATTTRKTATVPTDSTVQGWGYTKGIKLRLVGGGVHDGTTVTSWPAPSYNLKDTSLTDITYSPSNGTTLLNAVPAYRQDAQWGDWVFYWEGINVTNGQATPNGTKGGLIWKNGEFIMSGIFHVANTLAFYQAGTHTPGTINTGTIGASFYANNNGGGDTNSSAFFIQVCTAAGGWNSHEYFRFDKDGIYAYPASGRTGITGWFINESDALTNSEIDSILANAT